MATPGSLRTNTPLQPPESTSAGLGTFFEQTRGSGRETGGSPGRLSWNGTLMKRVNTDPKARTPRSYKVGEILEHKEATRTNIPTAGYQSIKDKEQRDLMRVGHERRSRDLDSQLVWRKDEHDWADLVVQAPPLYIQQKVHPKVLVDDLMRRTEVGERATDAQPDLFADFNGFTNYADLYKYLHRLVFTRKVSR